MDESDRDSGGVGVVMVADDLPIETEAADRADFPDLVVTEIEKLISASKDDGNE